MYKKRCLDDEIVSSEKSLNSISNSLHLIKQNKGHLFVMIEFQSKISCIQKVKKKNKSFIFVLYVYFSI
jgi:hypothetical protein